MFLKMQKTQQHSTLHKAELFVWHLGGVSSCQHFSGGLCLFEHHEIQLVLLVPKRRCETTLTGNYCITVNTWQKNMRTSVRPLQVRTSWTLSGLINFKRDSVNRFEEYGKWGSITCNKFKLGNHIFYVYTIRLLLFTFSMQFQILKHGSELVLRLSQQVIVMTNSPPATNAHLNCLDRDTVEVDREREVMEQTGWRRKRDKRKRGEVINKQCRGRRKWNGLKKKDETGIKSKGRWMGERRQSRYAPQSFLMAPKWCIHSLVCPPAACQNCRETHRQK